jgi:hypothetical protein
MADTEKAAASHDVHTPDYSNSESTELVLPPGRLYRSPGKLFGRKLPWYASPETQITLVAFVCFLCPGKIIQYQVSSSA